MRSPGKTRASWRPGRGCVSNKSKQVICIASSLHVGFPPRGLTQAEMVEGFKVGLAGFTDRLGEALGRACVGGLL